MNCLLFLIYEVFYRKKFIIDNGGSRDPCAQTYSGVGAFSEPESQAVKHFLEDSGIDFISYLTVHSYGQMWLYSNRKIVDTASTLTCTTGII
jgi:hypothetical protein